MVRCCEKERSGEIFSRLIPDVLKVMLETSDEARGLAKRRLAVRKKVTAREKESECEGYCVGDDDDGKHKHRPWRGVERECTAALPDTPWRKEKIKIKKKITKERFRRSRIPQLNGNKDELLTCLWKEASFGTRYADGNRNVSQLWIERVLFKEEEEEEERGRIIDTKEYNVRKGMCGSECTVDKSDGGFTKFTKGGNNSAVDEALLFEIGRNSEKGQ